MQDEEAIEEQMYEAEDQADSGDTLFPGMSYEDGVSAALRWVLGHQDETPMPAIDSI